MFSTFQRIYRQHVLCFESFVIDNLIFAALFIWDERTLSQYLTYFPLVFGFFDAIVMVFSLIPHSVIFCRILVGCSICSTLFPVMRHPPCFFSESKYWYMMVHRDFIQVYLDLIPEVKIERPAYSRCMSNGWVHETVRIVSVVLPLLPYNTCGRWTIWLYTVR